MGNTFLTLHISISASACTPVIIIIVIIICSPFYLAREKKIAPCMTEYLFYKRTNDGTMNVVESFLLFDRTQYE